jgi:hypothetical protein
MKTERIIANDTASKRKGKPKVQRKRTSSKPISLKESLKYGQVRNTSWAKVG